MGHARADVFRRHYMHQTVKVDTQSVYLGTTNRGDLIKTVGLMSNKRGPRAPVKLDAEDFKKRQFANRDLSTLIVELNRLVDILKAKCGTVTEARTLQPEKHQEYTRLVSRIHGIRRGLERIALKGSRATWFENADHDEIKRQLNGEDASTFTYRKLEFGCPLRSQISDAFSSVEAMTPNKWSETVRALSVLCTQKPRIHTKATESEENLCLFCYSDDKLSPADRFHSFYSLRTLRAHINKKYLPIMESREPAIAHTRFVRPRSAWGTLEKLSGSSSRSENLGKRTSRCGPAWGVEGGKERRRTIAE